MKRRNGIEYGEGLDAASSRASEKIGRPLGAPASSAKLEKKLDRILSRREPEPTGWHDRSTKIVLGIMHSVPKSLEIPVLGIAP
jgi:hypothetical protein